MISIQSLLFLSILTMSGILLCNDWSALSFLGRGNYRQRFQAKDGKGEHRGERHIYVGLGGHLGLGHDLLSKIGDALTIHGRILGFSRNLFFCGDMCGQSITSKILFFLSCPKIFQPGDALRFSQVPYMRNSISSGVNQERGA